MFRSARAGVSSRIVFFTPEEARGLEQPDGSLLIALDLDRPGVPVPSRDPDTWTEESCVGAFEKLSQTPSCKHYHDRTIGFLLMKLNRDQFYSLLTEAGLEVPKFWRPPVATAKEECESARVAKTLHQTPGSAARTRGPRSTKLEPRRIDSREIGNHVGKRACSKIQSLSRYRAQGSRRGSVGICRKIKQRQIATNTTNDK